MSLDLIRRRHRWLTLGILFFISVAFIFGIGSFVTGFGTSTGAPRGSAAEVNGEEISMVQYALVRDNLRRRLGQQEGELPQAAIDFTNMSALNQLIDLKLLAQKSKQMGFVVTKEEFNKTIHSDPVFQIDGKFVGAERYRNFIAQGLNQNVTEYENFYKERILVQKLLRFIDETIVVTDEKLLTVYNIQNEKVNLNYIKFSNTDFMDAYTPEEEEIEKYYQGRKANFKTDELRKIRYIVLEPEMFENNVHISDEELNAYYNAYTEEFLAEDGKTPPFEEVKSDVESKLKSQKGEVIRREFLESIEPSQNPEKSIDQIAKENSVESISESAPLSKLDRTGDIPPQIVNRAFAELQGKTILVPVGTTIWVMEVSEISEPREKTLDETKPEIITALKNQESNNRARKKANETLRKLKSTKKEEIAAKAKELGVNLDETGSFTRLERIPKINLEQIKSEVFELNENSTVLGKVYQNNNNFYVVIFKEKLSADPQNFEQQKEELKEQELQTQRSDLIQKWLQNLRREAKIVPNNNLLPVQG
ncbi:MAG: SurA N-terminal domain-containing protein [Candidatus Dadabacteria bacterium]|nr:SurA N-terminal domain-containing protein [Candidatus Dadabacteria bacterium]